MDKAMYTEILSHQLKGIMFHTDAYSVSCLHNYCKLKSANCKQLKEETENFMRTRCKSIEALGEIVDIPKQQIVIPRDSSPTAIIEMWHKWETETVALYSKAMATEPSCKLWMDLQKAAMKEVEAISRMR